MDVAIRRGHALDGDVAIAVSLRSEIVFAAHVRNTRRIVFLTYG